MGSLLCTCTALLIYYTVLGARRGLISREPVIYMYSIVNTLHCVLGARRGLISGEPVMYMYSIVDILHCTR